MSVIDVVIPTYRGLEPEANSALIAMQQASNCFCRDERTGTPLHLPWKCPKGKHSVRMMPPVSSSSVVHWARNQVVAQSLYGQPKGDNRPPAEYLFLMDDDMLALPHYLTRLVSYKADIVCGICTIRRDPPVPNIRFWFPKEASFRPPIEWDWDSNKLMEIDGAGAAFMLVKRTVFERIGQAYLDCAFELDEDLRKLDGLEGETAIRDYWARKSEQRHERFKAAIEQGNWSAADCWWFDFQKNVVDKQIGELGEDLSFCWKAKKMGFKIYADPQVLPGHIGKYGYSIADYKAHVEEQKAMGNAPPLKDNQATLVAEA